MMLVNAAKSTISITTGAASAAVGGVVGGVVGTCKLDPVGGFTRGAQQWGDAGECVGAGLCDGVGHLVKDPVAGTVAVGRGAYQYSRGAYSIVEDTGAVILKAPARIIESASNGYFDQEVKGLPLHCAFLSRCVYEAPRDRTRQWNFEDTKTSITLDDDVNMPSIALYLINESEMVLAFKGTSDREDIAPDMLIILGVLTAASREKEAELRKFLPGFGAHHESLGAYLKAKHPGRSLIATGHSLGGAAAMTMTGVAPNSSYVDYCYAFNPGTGFFQQNDVDELQGVVRNLEVWRAGESAVAWVMGWEKRIEAHHIFGDPISACTSGSAKTMVRTWKNGLLNTHSIDNFLPNGWIQAIDR